jgi:putative transposase
VRFHERRPLRLPRYEYRTPGAYFVTLVVHQRRCVLGHVVGDRTVTNAAGSMVIETWKAIPEWYRGASVDAAVVMPNHVHAILWIGASVSAAHGGDAANSLGLSDILHRFKTLTTYRYIAGVKTAGWPSFDRRLWQRSFYDRVIRDDAELARYREYIAANPLRWSLDPEFPANRT